MSPKMHLRGSNVWRPLAATAGAIAGLLTLRLLFRLLIANPANPAVAAILAISRPFTVPWSLLWPLTGLPALTVEPATVAALCAYLALGVLLGLLGTRRSTDERPTA